MSDQLIITVSTDVPAPSSAGPTEYTGITTKAILKHLTIGIYEYARYDQATSFEISDKFSRHVVARQVFKS